MGFTKFTDRDKRIFAAFCAVADESQLHNEITLTKVGEKLGMSKQAVSQATFGGINGIIGELHEYVIYKIVERMEDFLSKDRQKGFILFLAEDILPLLYEKRSYWATLSGGVADPSWSGFLEKRFAPMLEPLFEGTQQATDISKEFLARLTVQQTTAIVTRWLRSSEPEQPLDFQKKFIFLTTHSIGEWTETKAPSEF